MLLPEEGGTAAGNELAKVMLHFFNHKAKAAMSYKLRKIVIPDEVARGNLGQGDDQVAEERESPVVAIT